MNTSLRKWVSLLAALTLLVTCTVSGLVLPTSAATNLIVNGDLEADASQGWGNSAFVQDGVGVDGSRGIKIETTVNEGDSAVWPGPYYKAPFNAVLEANTTYVFSFDYKHEGKGFAKFDITRGGSDWTGWADVNLPNVEDWTTHTIEFTTGETANMNAQTNWEWAPAHVHYANASSYGTGAAYFDNFKLVKKSELGGGDDNDDTVTQLMPNSDFNAAASGWKDAAKNELAVQTDSADSNNKYVQIPVDGSVITSPNAEGTFAVGDWVKVTFRVRKNQAGKARLVMNWQGGMFTGYAAPYWSISTSETKANSDGEWFTYTVYGRAKTATTKVVLQFGMVAAHSTVGMDLDDVTVENLGPVAESTLNLVNGGSMDVQGQELNGISYDGLFYDGGELVADPDDATNNVLKMTANGQVYLYPDIRCTEAANSSTKTNTYFKAETVYKLTYRQKGTGTTNPKADTTRATLIAVEGEPTAASAAWKTVTMYFRTTTSLNPNYTIDFKTVGEVYLDDVALYEMESATSLTLNKTTLDMEIGDSETLTATTAPEGAYAQAIVWSSDAETVATVDQTGKVTAVASGNATITATSGSLTATCVVTVGEPAPATSIELDKTELTLKTGKTDTLTATTKPVGAPAEAIVWSTSNAAVATVENGVVTAVAEGTATITATSGTLTASCTVTVVAKATAFTIPQGDVQVVPNGTITLSMNETPVGGDCGTLTWTSSDTSIVTVDNAGVVTAVADSGSATVTVANEDGLSDSVTVTVSEFANLLPNGDIELGAAGMFHHLPSEGVSAEAGVGIDGSTALKFSKDHANSVTYFKNVGHLKNYLQPNSRYVLSLWTKGASIRLGCSTVTDMTFEDGRTFWNTTASEDWQELRVVIDTGAAPDMNSNWSFYLKHTSAVDTDTYVDNITLCKQPEAEQLVLAPSKVELLPDESVTLKVNTIPADTVMGKLTWTSSDTSVVTVDQNGLVTAIADSGTATITVTNTKNKTATATVTVNEYGNLLQNGDFESGTLNWTPPLGNIKEGVGKDGSWGHEILHTTPGKTESTFYKLALPLTPATTYEISFDYLLTSEDTDIRLWSGSIGLRTPELTVSKTGEWQHASRVFTTPTDMNLNPGWDMSIAVYAQGDSVAVIDNMCLRLYSSGVEATSVIMNKETLTLIPGRTENLAVVATPVNGDVNRTVWTSSDENVATVEYGVVTGVGKGTATITATTKNGLTATCKVTVSGEEVYVEDGTFDGDNDAWTMTNVTLAPDIGTQNSKAAALVEGSTLSQSFAGLKPNTEYQLLYRYRSAGGKATVTLTSGTTELVKETTGSETRWIKRIVEFKTGAEVADTTVLTFTGLGNVYIENVVLAEKASLIDFVVDSIVWDGGDYQVKPGTNLLFAVTVINKGTDTVPVGTAFSVEVRKNGKAIQTLKCTVDAPIDTGEAVIVMSDTPWAAETGDWVISARVNPDLAVLELDTTNNAKQVNLRVNETIFEAPEQAQQAGFTDLTFSDEFDSVNSIDTTATGNDGYKWYVTRQWGATTVTRDAYDVENGILTLHDPVPTYGITLTTVDVNTQIGYSWNKGYLEVRCRIPSPKDTYGGGPTVWSFPLTKQYEIEGQNNHWVEADWLEFWGNIPQHPNGYWTVSMHETTKDPSTGETLSGFTNGKPTVDAMGDKEWHTLGWLWDHNIVRAYMDGVQVFEQTYDADSFPNPLPRVNTGELKNGIFTAMNEQIMCLYLSGSTEVPFEVDYVHIWQGQGGGITPNPGGDDNDKQPEIIVDISAENFWNNYCTDDWGDPIVTVNEENYQYVLDGGEYWQYLTAERKAEINALLKENGQPTFEELLEAANKLKNGEDPYPQPTPETGVVSALPIAAIGLLLSGAVVGASRKRKEE